MGSHLHACNGRGARRLAAAHIQNSAATAIAESESGAAHDYSPRSPTDIKILLHAKLSPTNGIPMLVHRQLLVVDATITHKKKKKKKKKKKLTRWGSLDRSPLCLGWTELWLG